MDIHKPKAAHSIREFAIEIGTIICGILIALGLEQVVEAVRVQREVAETREALHAEIADNAMRAKVMIAENTCAAGARAIVTGWLAGGPRPGMAAHAMMLPLSSTVWDTAHAKGVAYMPMQEQLRLAGYYTGIRLYNENENRRREVGLRYASIAMLDRPTPEQAGRLMEDLNGLEIMRTYQIGNARRALDFAAESKVAPVPVDTQMRDSIGRYCQQAAMPTPRLD